jgi:CBS domain-containing protein
MSAKTSKRPPKKAAARPAKRRPAPKPAAAKAAPPRTVPAARPAARPLAGADRWALVTAGDLMKTNVVTVAYSAPLSEVEQILSESRISGAPVVDQTGQILGVISLKDLNERYAEDPDAKPRHGRGFFHLSSLGTLDGDFDSFEVPAEAEETARDLMTADIYRVPVGAGLKSIADVMCKHHVHRVLVEDQGRLVGILSTLDVLEALRA